MRPCLRYGRRGRRLLDWWQQWPARGNHQRRTWSRHLQEGGELSSIQHAVFVLVCPLKGCLRLWRRPWCIDWGHRWLSWWLPGSRGLTLWCLHVNVHRRGGRSRISLRFIALIRVQVGIRRLGYRWAYVVVWFIHVVRLGFVLLTASIHKASNRHADQANQNQGNENPPRPRCVGTAITHRVLSGHCQGDQIPWS